LTTLEFLTQLYGDCEAGYLYLWTTPDKLSEWYSVTDLTAAAQGAERLSAGRKNVYYGLGLTAAPKQPDERATAPDVTAIPGLWVELDLRDETHPNNPTDVAELLALVQAWPLPPTIIVHSGHGVHAYWLFREPWDITEDRARAADLVQRFQAAIKQPAIAKGWKVDSTHDLSRVLRLPGTVNFKAEPVPVTMIHAGPDRYNPDDFEQFLPDAPTAATTERRASRFERRPTDGPAAHMLANCIFMQHVQLNAKSITYQEWLAALTNLVRASDGIQAAHYVSGLDTARYNQRDTEKKIDECLAAMHPQTCQYIQRDLGFTACPAGGCGTQAPCGWSLGKLPQAKALIRSISVPTPETVYSPQVMGALALIQKEAPAEYDMFFQRCKGQVNLNTLRAEVKRQRASDSGFTVYEGGESVSGTPENVHENPESVTDSTDTVNGHWLAAHVPDVPLNLQLPRASNTTTWFFRQNGVALKRVTQNGESFFEVSYAPILITERIYNIDTMQEKARVTFRTSRHGWRSVVLPKSVIFDGKRIMCLADAGLTMNGDMARNLSKWLSALEAANINIIPERVGVSKLGWRNDDREFILPGMQSSFTLDASTTEAEGVLGAMAVAGDYGVWADTMRHLRTKPRARFILAASFAAPLLKIVGQRTFLVHNWGTTADGKTATLQAAMSVWGKPEELYRTFDNTKASLEKTAELFTDLPLGINEYEVLNDRRKGEVDTIVYTIGEGKGRGRANKDGSLQRAASWRTIAIMNGESPITRNSSRGGVITRVIELHGGPLKNDEVFASDLYRILARNHGHAGRAFIHKLLQANHDELRDTYNKTRYALRQVHPGKLDSHIDALSCIVMADYLSSMWIFGTGEADAGAEAIAMGEAILAELVVKSEANESERAWDWLQDWIAANSAKLQKEYAHKEHVGTVIGYVDMEYVYIIKTELSNAMRNEGFSPEKVYRAWADEGRIPVNVRTNGQKDYGIKGRSIGGSQPWVIRIPIGVYG
jgi:putative DNA primase/helicase